MDKQKVSLSVPKKILREAKHFAVDQGVSLSGVLVEALAERVKRRLPEWDTNLLLRANCITDYFRCHVSLRGRSASRRIAHATRNAAPSIGQTSADIRVFNRYPKNQRNEQNNQGILH